MTRRSTIGWTYLTHLHLFRSLHIHIIPFNSPINRLAIIISDRLRWKLSMWLVTYTVTYPDALPQFRWRSVWKCWIVQCVISVSIQNHHMELSAMSGTIFFCIHHDMLCNLLKLYKLRVHCPTMQPESDYRYMYIHKYCIISFRP